MYLAWDQCWVVLYFSPVFVCQYHPRPCLGPQLHRSDTPHTPSTPSPLPHTHRLSLGSCPPDPGWHSLRRNQCTSHTQNTAYTCHASTCVSLEIVVKKIHVHLQLKVYEQIHVYMNRYNFFVQMVFISSWNLFSKFKIASFSKKF